MSIVTTSEIPGFTVFHSASNDILFDGTETGKSGADLVALHRDKGIIFQPQSHLYGHDGWFCLTLGTEEDNRKAVEIMLEFYAQSMIKSGWWTIPACAFCFPRAK